MGELTSGLFNLGYFQQLPSMSMHAGMHACAHIHTHTHIPLTTGHKKGGESRESE